MLQRRGSYEFWTPPNPRDFRFGEAGGRLELVSSSELGYQIYRTGVLEVNGENVQIPGGSGLTVDVTEDLIDNTGIPTGLQPATLARTYAYIGNSSSAIAAPALRLSSSAPVDYNGFKYLATSGGGENWRFVGWVGTLGSPTVQFRDDDTARLIANAYNRVRKSLYLCPGYNDNNTDTTYTINSAAWAGIGTTASLTDTVAFVSNGEDSIAIDAVVSPHTSAGGWRIGIGVAGTIATARTTVKVAAQLRNGIANHSTGCSWGSIISDGFYFAALSAYTVSVTMTVHADLARNGAVADTAATYLQGSVWC
jgi:hypothetical protein